MPDDTTKLPKVGTANTPTPADDGGPLAEIKPRDSILAEGSNTFEGGAATPAVAPAPAPARGRSR